MFELGLSDLGTVVDNVNARQSELCMQTALCLIGTYIIELTFELIYPKDIDSIGTEAYGLS